MSTPVSGRVVGLVLVLGTALVGACAQPLHLQYDYGRAYMTTFRVQADLTRPSVAQLSYSLYGPEAAAIRLNVQQTSTEKQDVNESTVESN